MSDNQSPYEREMEKARKRESDYKGKMIYGSDNKPLSLDEILIKLVSFTAKENHDNRNEFIPIYVDLVKVEEAKEQLTHWANQRTKEAYDKGYGDGQASKTV